MQLPKCNNFYRKLMYQEHHKKYSDSFSLESRVMDDNERVLIVTKLKSSNEMEESIKQKHKARIEEFENAKGFSKVLQLLVKSKKLVVGHNPCLDILHTIDKFLVPLPDDYYDFKEMAYELFPKIIDTKFMCNSGPFNKLVKSSILNHILKSVQDEPFQIPKVVINPGCSGYSICDNKEHEAGYDAYLTGLVFLTFWKYLGASSNKDGEETFANFDLLEPYFNKISLACLIDNQYICLGGEDLNVKKDHIFHLSFPKEWTKDDIVQLFSPFSEVNVYWINETSAYVSLYRKDQAKAALNALENGENYTIMSFNRRQAILEFNGPSPGLKRKSTNYECIAPAKKIRLLNESAKYDREESEENDQCKSKKKVFMEDSSWD